MKWIICLRMFIEPLVSNKQLSQPLFRSLNHTVSNHIFNPYSYSDSSPILIWTDSSLFEFWTARVSSLSHPPANRGCLIHQRPNHPSLLLINSCPDLLVSSQTGLYEGFNEGKKPLLYSSDICIEESLLEDEEGWSVAVGSLSSAMAWSC